MNDLSQPILYKPEFAMHVHMYVRPLWYQITVIQCNVDMVKNE